MNSSDLCFAPAVELAELIRRRALSPVEITRAVLERIERLNPALGAYVLVHAERALEQARRAEEAVICLLYTSPSPRDGLLSRMPSSA